MANLQVDHIICVGDIVGYGPDPAPITEAIRKHACVMVGGNHDAVACGRMGIALFNDKPSPHILNLAKSRLKALHQMSIFKG